MDERVQKYEQKMTKTLDGFEAEQPTPEGHPFLRQPSYPYPESSVQVPVPHSHPRQQPDVEKILLPVLPVSEYFFLH